MARYTTISRGEGGKPNGHVPGHTYHDVVVCLRSRPTGDGMRYQVLAHEVWGSTQGRDEEHGRTTVAATNMPTIASALRELTERARVAGFPAAYLSTAVSEVEMAAEQTEDA